MLIIFLDVNNAIVNMMSLHCKDDCPLIISRDSFSGQISTSNCYTFASGQGVNEGCHILATSRNAFGSNSYGDSFNKIGGGVYIMEWTSDFIKIWHFPRPLIPIDIEKGRPSPNSWGKPLANFVGQCDFNQEFLNQAVFLNL